jgi:hypothetical protein
MNKLTKISKQFLADIYRAKPYSLILLLVACSWSYLVGVAYLTNAFGYYPLNKLLNAIIFLPVIYIILAWVVGHFILAPHNALNRQDFFALLIACTVLICLFIIVFPPPLPGLAKEQQLKLVVLGEKNQLSGGSGVEITKLRNLDGRSIPWGNLALTGDWQIRDNKLLSSGDESSILEYNGPAYGGIVFNFLYDSQSGKINIYSGDTSQLIDLYAPEPTILNAIYKSPSWKQLEPAQIFIYLIVVGLYIIGVASLILLIVFGIEFLGSKRLTLLVIISLYLLAFVVFVNLKLLYPTFDGERVFRDTYSYVAAGERSLASGEFWIGERSFTLPLMFKLLGLNTQNFQTNIIMSQVMRFQTWFSIVCWTFLGLTLGISIRKRWLGIGAFGIVLLFSLCLEISLWDSLLLSESISLSLFACLVGLWILFETLPPVILRSAIGWLLFLLLVIVTTLYSFTRDTNLYFVIISGLLFVLFVWLKKKDKIQRIYYSVYAVIVIVLFVFQSYSVSVGNRWQVLIYDHLALRLLQDELAIKYLESRGLPIDDALMSVTDMTPPEFQSYFLTSDNMQAVRDWVDSNGKTIYLQYLLSRPGSSLLGPIYEYRKLINGSSVEYRREKQPVRSIPEVITRITKIFYPRSPLILGFMFVISIVGVSFWLIGPDKRSVWLIVLLLVASIYPLMFIIWHGNPQEIERHAIQIAVQLRLAGWMAVIVWLAWLDTKIGTHHQSDENSPLITR